MFFYMPYLLHGELIIFRTEYIMFNNSTTKNCKRFTFRESEKRKDEEKGKRKKEDMRKRKEKKREGENEEKGRNDSPFTSLPLLLIFFPSI